jgi:hypothetical protein
MSYSPIIYKYRTWSDPNHKACLLNNELYFASPSDINDPFDCNITVDYSLLESDEKREKYADKVAEEASIILDPNHLNFKNKKQEFLTRLKNDPETLQNEFDLISYKEISKYLGVLSFSQRWDSILMWTHYATNHKGFCIGFNREKIIKSERFGLSGGIIYSDSFPKIDPIENNIIETTIKQMNTKASDWRYEEE